MIENTFQLASYRHSNKIIPGTELKGTRNNIKQSQSDARQCKALGFLSLTVC